MLKIKDRILKPSKNVTGVIDIVTQQEPNEIHFIYKLTVRPSFKEILAYIFNKKAILVGLKHFIYYEEINNTNITTNSTSNQPNPPKKSKSKKNNSSTTTEEQSTKSE